MNDMADTKELIVCYISQDQGNQENVKMKKKPKLVNIHHKTIVFN